MTAVATSPIALVGLPGVGKSTVARELQLQLGCSGVDLDEVIVERGGRTIAEIFASDGEAGFRRLEHRALLAALATGAGVIACGAGALTQPETAALLLEHTTLVWLDAPDELVLQRLRGGDARPLLQPDPATRLSTLRAQRSGRYAQAQVRVEADAAPDEVALRVRTVLGR